jgi:hypothetical protein
MQQDQSLAHSTVLSLALPGMADVSAARACGYRYVALCLTEANIVRPQHGIARDEPLKRETLT